MLTIIEYLTLREMSITGKVIGKIGNTECLSTGSSSGLNRTCDVVLKKGTLKNLLETGDLTRTGTNYHKVRFPEKWENFEWD